MGDDDEFPMLPITPSKPPLAKKPALAHMRPDNIITDDAVRILSNLINSRSDALEKMLESVRMEVQDLHEKVASIEGRVKGNEEAGKACMSRVTDLERYGRRWNLRHYGVPEADKEVIYICQEILPSEREKLPDAIDVAHRVGKLRQDSKPRGIILRFISRRHRDAVWKAAKNNAFLNNKGLRFTEDLTKEDRENRNKLWPLIKSARDEGKAAYFVGGRGFVNGSEIRA